MPGRPRFSRGRLFLRMVPHPSPRLMSGPWPKKVKVQLHAIRSLRFPACARGWPPGGLSGARCALAYLTASHDHAQLTHC